MKDVYNRFGFTNLFGCERMSFRDDIIFRKINSEKQDISISEEEIKEKCGALSPYESHFISMSDNESSFNHEGIKMFL